MMILYLAFVIVLLLNGKGFPQTNSRAGNGGKRPSVSLAQLMKGEAHRSPFATFLYFVTSRRDGSNEG